MKWIARIIENKGKNNKKVCTSKKQNNNPEAEFFNINSPLNEKEKIIVKMLYNYCKKNHICIYDLEEVGIYQTKYKNYIKKDTNDFIEPIYDDYHKNNIRKKDINRGITVNKDKFQAYITVLDFIQKFVDNPHGLKQLLDKIPDICVLKYVFDERYTYDEVINIICPYFSKIRYIDGMKDKKYTCAQIKYCIENGIFIPIAHDNFDYDKIDMIIKEKGYILENSEKNFFIS